MSTRAFRTLDCAWKVRMRFYLPRAVDFELIAALGAEVDQLEEFSQFVAGARDHVRFSMGATWRGSASLGENLIVVTFGKLGDGSEERSIEEFIETLECLGCGPVIQQLGANARSRESA